MADAALLLGHLGREERVDDGRAQRRGHDLGALLRQRARPVARLDRGHRAGLERTRRRRAPRDLRDRPRLRAHRLAGPAVRHGARGAGPPALGLGVGDAAVHARAGAGGGV